MIRLFLKIILYYSSKFHEISRQMGTNRRKRAKDSQFTSRYRKEDKKQTNEWM